MAGTFFTLDILPDGIAVLNLDEPDSRVNTLHGAMMETLSFQLELLSKNTAVKALLVQSVKPGIFIAGADIREIQSLREVSEAEGKSKRGQEILGRLASLPFPSVAAIDGACLGGGLELALACTYRVASDGAKVRLGLPETGLGVIPGFGGTYRLPGLVGLQAALPVILAGKNFDGKKAWKIGLVDACYPQTGFADRVLEFTRSVLEPAKARSVRQRRRKTRGFSAFPESLPFVRAFIFLAARKKVLRRTHGYYPAPLEALSVLRKGFGSGERHALQLERQAFGKMAVTEVSKNLVRVFFATEALKKDYSPKDELEEMARHGEIRSLGILGAGKMGGAIAWLGSSGGLPVRMKDVSWAALGNGFASVHEIYGDLVRIGKTTPREAGLGAQRVTGMTDYSGFADIDFVIEAIVEDLDVKRKALAELESRVRPDAILATNTSSLSVAELSESLERPDRFVGFHFFNPVSRMPLIEVVPGPKTSRATLLRAVEFARRLGKTPIVVKDGNGFLVNRVLMSYLNEALLLLEEGMPFPEIDRAVVGWGMPMGPYELLDEIGIKVSMKVSHVLSSSYPDRTEPGRLHNVIAGSDRLVGKSSGEGFYLYAKGKRKTPNPLVASILVANGVKPAAKADIQAAMERCAMRLVNEAALCMQDGLVERPDQLDLAMILGTGFPPFRGGLLAWADSEGLAKFAKRLSLLEEKYGKRFKPALNLTTENGGRGRFYV